MNVWTLQMAGWFLAMTSNHCLHACVIACVCTCANAPALFVSVCVRVPAISQGWQRELPLAHTHLPIAKWTTNGAFVCDDNKKSSCRMCGNCLNVDVWFQRVFKAPWFAFVSCRGICACMVCQCFHTLGNANWRACMCACTCVCATVM